MNLAFAACAALTLAAAGPGRLEEARPWLGVQLKAAPAGVVVENVFPDSPAAATGVRIGDVIRKLDGRAVATPQQVIELVARASVGGTLKLELATPAGGASRAIAVKLAVRPELSQLARAQLVGKTAPDFALEPAGAGAAPARRLGDLKGKVVLLDFWATWCQPCVAALPHLQQLHERYAKKGLQVVGVTSDDAAQVSALVKRRGLGYGQVFDRDGQIGSRYLVTAVPTLVIIGRDGKVVDISIGDPSALDATLVRLLD